MIIYIGFINACVPMIFFKKKVLIDYFFPLFLATAL